MIFIKITYLYSHSVNESRSHVQADCAAGTEVRVQSAADEEAELHERDDENKQHKLRPDGGNNIDTGIIDQ